VAKEIKPNIAEDFAKVGVRAQPMQTY
jgi:hypothetical protein